MFKKIFLTVVMGVLLSGCFMAPMALIGPATSGFTTASLVQSGATTGISMFVKKTTGKTISQHAFDSISIEVLQQSYFPKIKNNINTKKIHHH
jgi:hypothetical protein